jgi:4-amino-4-deoxy-L-arabinose transferase-like glycosyltransferase
MENILTNRNIQLSFVGFILFIMFLGNSSLTLWDNSESQTALIAQQIVETNEGNILFSNFFDGLKSHPLQVFETVLTYQIFGINEFSTRLPSVLYIILTFIALIFFVHKIYDEKTAILSAVILASTFGIVGLAKINLAESGLVFYETVMVFSLWLYYKSPNWKYLGAFWVAMALSFFQGGFVAAFPIIATLGILFFIKKGWREKVMNIKPWLLGIILLPLIIYLIMTFSIGGTPNQQIFQAAFLDKSGHFSFGKQTLIMIVCFLPWLAFLPTTLVRLTKRIIKKEEEAIYFGSILVFGWLIYELIPTSMALPSTMIYPILAVLMSQRFFEYEAACERFDNLPINQHVAIRVKKANFKDENLIKTGQLLGVILVFVLMFILSMMSYSQGVGIMKASFVGMILWITSFAVAIGLYSRNTKLIFINATIGGVLTMFFAWLLLVPILEPARSVAYRLAAETAIIAEEKPVVLYTESPYNLPSLPFYLNKNKVNYTFTNDYEELMKTYLSNDSTTLVVDEFTFKTMKKIVTEGKYKAEKLEAVEGILFTEFKSGNYWIVK